MLRRIAASVRNYIARIKNARAAKKKFEADKKLYMEQCAGKNSFLYAKRNEMPILYEYNEPAGCVDMHYFLQDIFAARYCHNHGFTHVYDIGSRIDGFIAHLLGGGVHVSMLDIRPFPIKVDDLDFVQSDATHLSNIQDDSIPVLTCLHAVEHFGLGRYGDRIDYDGWRKALRSYSKKVKKSGTLIISVPVSSEDRLVFNAHRIFSPVTIYDELCGDCKLESFTRIYDYKLETTDFIHDGKEPRAKLSDVSKSLGDYDCGVFIFKKL